MLFPPSQYPPVHDSTSGPDSPDLELFTTPLAYKEHGLIHFDMHTLALHVYLLRLAECKRQIDKTANLHFSVSPTSQGAVKLVSNSPWDDPTVNPKLVIFMESVKTISL